MTFEPKLPLALDTELRYHAASQLHTFVAGLLGDVSTPELRALSRILEDARYHLRITRDLNTAKDYLRERYADDPEARFGLIASARDRDLVRFGIPNDWQSTRRVRYGPWYSSPENDYQGQSCRLLQTCVTEFGAQGLELDAVLLAWGTDLIRTDGRWTNANARGYKRGAKVRNPLQLRINAYRVLLTRGRDATVVFLPPISSLDETFEHLTTTGFSLL